MPAHQRLQCSFMGPLTAHHTANAGTSRQSLLICIVILSKNSCSHLASACYSSLRLAEENIPTTIEQAFDAAAIIVLLLSLCCLHSQNIGPCEHARPSTPRIDPGDHTLLRLDEWDDMCIDDRLDVMCPCECQLVENLLPSMRIRTGEVGHFCVRWWELLLLVSRHCYVVLKV